MGHIRPFANRRQPGLERQRRHLFAVAVEFRFGDGRIRNVPQPVDSAGGLGLRRRHASDQMQGCDASEQTHESASLHLVAPGPEGLWCFLSRSTDKYPSNWPMCDTSVSSTRRAVSAASRTVPDVPSTCSFASQGASRIHMPTGRSMPRTLHLASGAPDAGSSPRASGNLTSGCDKIA